MKLVDEEINRTLIIDGVLMIRDSKSPTLVREMLLAYLPEKHRHDRSRTGAGAGLEPEGASHGQEKKRGHAGGHGWFVTFADLMGLLVSFFVMLVAFSTQDKPKLQIVAGSMRDAFGVQQKSAIPASSRSTGSRPGPSSKNVANINPPKMPPTHRARTSKRSAQQGIETKRAGSRLRARVGLAAAGAAGHAGDRRNLQDTS